MTTSYHDDDDDDDEEKEEEKEEEEEKRGIYRLVITCAFCSCLFSMHVMQCNNDNFSAIIEVSLS